MKVGRARALGLGIAIFVVIAIGCSVTHMVYRENGFDSIDVAVPQLVGSEQRQVIDNVTVTVTPVSMGADEFITITRKKEMHPGFCGGGTEWTLERLVPTLRDKGSVPIFKVDIHNGTDHVISIGGGTVIAYIPEGASPVSPLAGFAVNGQGPAGLTAVNATTNAAEARFQVDEKQALINSLMALEKLPKLNETARVLPNYSYVGYVVFDYDLLKGGSTGEFRIFDLVTRVDATGAAVKKAMFAWKYNIAKGKASAIPGALGTTASQFKATNPKGEKVGGK